MIEKIKNITRNGNGINTTLYKWFKKCEASRIYESGSLIIEEAMNIKDLLNNPDLNDFKAFEK